MLVIHHCPLAGYVLVVLSVVMSGFHSNFMLLQSSREQLAIAEFARSLLVIPKQLAVNAAQDSTDLVAKLRAFHNTSQLKSEHSDLKWRVNIR